MRRQPAKTILTAAALITPALGVPAFSPAIAAAAVAKTQESADKGMDVSSPIERLTIQMAAIGRALAASDNAEVERTGCGDWSGRWDVGGR